MRALRAGLFGAALVAASAVGLAAPAGAQEATTTTTSIPSLPVTEAPDTATSATDDTARGDLADTGTHADILVGLGLGLVVLGAGLQAGERLTRRTPRLTIG